ncbi:MAG: FecR family protein [Methylococcales bacterium]
MPSAEPDSAFTQLDEQACAWLVRYRSGEMDASERERLDLWRLEAPDHERVWRRAEALWQGIEPLSQRPIPGSAPLPIESSVRSAQRRIDTNPVRLQRHGAWRLAFAGAVLSAIALCLLFPPLYWQADFLTGKGELLTRTLADGSRLTLNTDSAVAIDFDRDTRRIELLSGETFVEVAKDVNYPFVVSAEEGEVRAVGTAFSVRRQDGGLRVELLEGIVDVEDRRHRRKERLHPGQVAEVDAEAVHIHAPIELDSLASWRHGYLQFDGVALSDAIEQINRYRPGRVVLLNGRLARHRVSGLYRLDALDEALDTLTIAVPGLKKTAVTPYLIFLR